jgi:hypothetical protein
MTATDTPGPEATRDGGEGPDASALGTDATDGSAGEGAEAPAGDEPRPRFDDRFVGLIALALTLAPFVVAAIALLVTVGGDYYPVSDHALTELQVRSVGRDEVLVGLYSRGDWNHPGPAAFYLMAPFYWVTGGMSASMNVAALAINGAAVAGMAIVARRRGGLPLMLLTLIACGLLMRMLGADFLQDPWNCFVTTLPFGLLIYLSWAMWGREVWALPAAAAVATAMAQAHVGFALLGPPLLAWGAVGLVVATALLPDPAERSLGIRRLVRGGAITAGVLLVLWLPPMIEGILHSPSNFGNIVRYFRHPEEDTHSVAEGWRVMTGQFGGVPEWLSTKRDFTYLGESPFVDSSPLPWLLVLMLVSGVVLARRAVDGARALVATTLVALVLGIVAVARTVGLAFDYRLRWTYLPAMLGVVVIGWAGWTVVAGRWPRTAGRLLVPGALVVVAGLGAVNVVTGATAGTPQNGNHDAMVSLTDQVLDELPETDGTIFVDDAFHSGAWHARGLVLQLERRGIDVGVDRSLVHEYGRHRIAEADEIGAVLVVTMDDTVDLIAERPNLRRIAYWTALPEDEMQALLDERDELRAAIDGGALDGAERDAAQERLREIYAELPGDGGSIAYRAAVFVDESFRSAPAVGDAADG